MPTSLTSTNVTFNDNTVCTSGKQVAKAWAYNIQSNLSITSSYNISSVTISSSTYTVYFVAGAVSDTNYCVIPVAFNFGAGSNTRTCYPRSGQTTSNFRVIGCQQGGAPMATAVIPINVLVFANTGT